MAVTRNSRPGSASASQQRRSNRGNRNASSRTRRHRRVNYTEYTTDDDDFLNAYPSSEPDSSPEVVEGLQTGFLELSQSHTTRTSKADRTGRNSNGARSKATTRSQSRITRRKRNRSAPGQLKKRRRIVAEENSDAGQGAGAFVPDWMDPRIPFDCWTDIFLYAAREGSTEIISYSWLVHAATTCKALSEPALTAIYRCPAIKTTAKAKRLASLIDRQPSETLFNYRAKIEALHINIHVVSPTLAFQLIRPLNRLKALIVYTPLDQPPYRDLDKTVRWHYPEDIFRALDADAGSTDSSPPPNAKTFPAVLKNWEWSGRFVGGFVASIDTMVAIHQTASFSQLTRLCLTNFQVPSLKKLRVSSEEKELESYHEDGAVIASVAHAISQLATLKHLVFESSTVMNDRMLPLLPKNLLHLELINCWEIKSEDFAAFLRTHGSDIRTLTLMHNQSLDLGFLTDLAETCPRLRNLDMNMSYYRHHDCVNDADPMYDQALLPSQVPKWPSSLRVLRIEHIRDWTVETAEMFLQSIIDSAPELPDLRHLSIKTMLDIPWQWRATMRREWRTRMDRVFLRPYTPPRPFTTLRSASDAEVPTRSPPGSSTNLPDGEGVRAYPTRKLERHQGDSRPSYKEPDTDVDELSSDEQESGVDDADSSGDHDHAASPPTNSRSGTETPIFVHGQCSTVNILFDNQKVRELQYSMEDFGSEETDSGEEWDGDYDDDEHVVAF
ncbi:hypothetical protein AAL_05006 [Moelleriella libera RCEF 2490]|uniref:Uncharacterized protein n=1 Tax=Moelleriella libera RCEF 2490 TaxID=1081109 RepID=A0A168B763_9HYPO|nr:hypothetical protein AAL_05006 [Moelleriella libera RCEF 2490]